jgi:hypothetical protein
MIALFGRFGRPRKWIITMTGILAISQSRQASDEPYETALSVGWVKQHRAVAE